MEERKKPGQVAAKFREPAGLKILHNFHLCGIVEEKLWRLLFLLPSTRLGDLRPRVFDVAAR